MNKLLLLALMILFTTAGMAQSDNANDTLCHKEKVTFFQYDYNLGNDVWNGFNRHFAFGRRYFFGKTYQIGLGWGFDWNRFVTKRNLFDGYHNADKYILRNLQFRGELLQRITLQKLGIHWDLGVFGGINITRRVKAQDVSGNEGPYWTNTRPYNQKNTMYYGYKALNLYEYGVTSRLSFNISKDFRIGVYASYRLSDIIVIDDPIIGTIEHHQPTPWNYGIDFELTP